MGPASAIVVTQGGMAEAPRRELQGVALLSGSQLVELKQQTTNLLPMGEEEVLRGRFVIAEKCHHCRHAFLNYKLYRFCSSVAVIVDSCYFRG